MWEGVGDQTKTALYWPPPPLLWPSALCLSRSPDVQSEARGLSFLLSAGFLYHILSPTGLQNSLGVPRDPSAGCGFPYHIFSPTRLISNWLGVPRDPSPRWWFSLPYLVSNSSDLQLTGFLSPPSYIIVQSPTQSLEWHVWSSSSENNCHAVHRSLSSGASVYECTMGFLPCPIFLAKSAYTISSHNCHRNVSLPSGASLWNGMFGRVEGQYTTHIHICMQKHIQHNNDERRHLFFRKIYLSLYWKGCVWEGVEDWTELQHIDPPNSSDYHSLSFPFSWAAQQGVWGPSLCWDIVLIPTSSLQLIWTSCRRGYIIIWRPTYFLRASQFTLNLTPSTVKVAPWYLRPDAPVIYIGAFLPLTAWSGSICNTKRR